MTDQQVPPPPADESNFWARLWKDQATLTTVALYLIIAATSWYLLQEFVTLLRPLLLAVLLCYVLLPAHLRLKKRMPSLAAIAVIVAGTVVGLLVLALLVFSSAVELSEDLPFWIQSGQNFFHEIEIAIGERFPWLAPPSPSTGTVEAPGTNYLRNAAAELVVTSRAVVGESFIVGIYLLFILLEVRRFPDRVRAAFPPERAEQILAVAGNISDAMASYLKVKVRASLILAIPVVVVLWPLGIKFPLMWGILTFIVNFIPYLGSIIACSLPILLGFLQMGFDWRPITAAVLIISIHMVSAYLVEPRMTGKAVGLSPLVILLALAFWGMCWGPIGMVLAVPLTVMLKIILDHVAITRPIARLMGD